MRAVLIFVLCAAPCFGQGVVQLQGGGSSFEGNGGGITLFGRNSETHFSAGVLNGRFAYGASEEFEFHGWDVTGGDKQFALTSGQMYLSTPVRGVSAFRRRPFACKDIVKTTGRLLGYLGQHC